MVQAGTWNMVNDQHLYQYQHRHRHQHNNNNHDNTTIIIVVIIIIIMVMSIIYWLNLGLYRPSVWLKLILLPNLIARGQFILILLASYTWEISCDIFYIRESYSSAIISQLSEKFCKIYCIFFYKSLCSSFNRL